MNGNGNIIRFNVIFKCESWVRLNKDRKDKIA